MAIAAEVKTHLIHDLIPFWLSLKDEQNGGFYGYVDSNSRIDRKADKGCVLNSRIMWAMSSCYKLCIDGALSETKLQDVGYSSLDILEAARCAYEYFRDHFVDMDYGGIFWSVTYDGQPADTTKHTYNHAFAIYALCAYYEVSGDREAFKLAYYLKNCIENTMADEYGYVDSFNRDFTPNSNPLLSENGVTAYRSMNTHINVMEAYSELYRINKETKDIFVKKKIYKTLDIHATRIYNPAKGRQEVFFDREYNSLIDLYSPGHDIEVAWMLDKICENVGDPELTERENPISRTIESNVLNYAFDGSSLILEFENGIASEYRHWWGQAEAVVGFVNAYMRTGDKRYKAAARAEWDFIKKYVIDKQRPAEWTYEVTADGTPNMEKALVSPWKCPFHNIRMCIEIIRRQERFDDLF